MCWNSSVSLNTFLFSISSLLLIIYNNTFTQYKIQEINSFWVYIFFLSFILMQLIEYFIWNHLNNKSFNKILTILAFILLGIQPMCSLMIINNKNVRNMLLFIYVFLLLICTLLINDKLFFYTIVDKERHLYWNFYKNYNIIYFILFLIYFFFLLIGLFIEKKYAILIIGTLSFIFVYLKYLNSGEQSFKSVWCWSVNLIMLYYIIYLIIYLPLVKK